MRGVWLVQNRNNIGKSIKTVLDMVPHSIGNIMPYNRVDPWWGVRNIINPVIIMFSPCALFLTLVQYLNGYISIIIYIFMIVVQIEFVNLYSDWNKKEGEMAIIQKMMEEEQKLD